MNICLFVVLVWNYADNGESDRGLIHLSDRIDVFSLDFDLFFLSLVSFGGEIQFVSQTFQGSFLRQV